MKRTKLFGLMMALVVGMGFTACSDDEDAFINITVEGNVPKTLTVGDSLTINYSVVSSDRLDIIEYVINKGNKDVVESVKEFTSNTSHTGSFTITAEEVGTINATIRVTDRKGKVEPRDFAIKVAGKIESFTAVLMGSYDDTNLGSFYSTVTDSVYKITPAGENSELIDFAYFYGSTNEATISAPDNDDVFGTGDGQVFGQVTSWAKRLETRFTKISAENLTVDEFDAAENDEIITENEAEELSKMVNKLQDGDLVFFVTEDGKKGIFKVADLDAKAKTITLEVKVQK